MNRRIPLLLALTASAALCVVTFTPLVIPTGEVQPFILGLPRTLWLGIAVSVLLTGLTAATAALLPSSSETPEE